jgi:hypothetical protein
VNGKSTIAQSFAQHSAETGRLGASFYCSRDIWDRGNIRFIFPTIVFNIGHYFQESRAALIAVLRECHHTPFPVVKNNLV